MKKHLGYYICQIGVLGAVVLAISQTQGNTLLQLFLVLFMALFYCFWGIVHHVIHHDLRLKIVLEYCTIALMGIAIIMLVMKGVL